MVEAKVNGHDREWSARAERKQRELVGGSYSVSEIGPSPARRSQIPGLNLRSSGQDVIQGLGFSISPSTGGEQLTDVYAENPWVRIAVKAKAGGLSQLPLVVYDRDSATDKDAQPIANHPLLRLLANPNPLLTQAELWQCHVKFFCLDGECYWFLAKRNGKPLAGNPELLRLTEAPEILIIVRGSAVEVKTNDLGFPIAYRYKGKAGAQIEFPAHSVVSFLDHDPKNLLHGVGDGESAFATAALMYQAERFLDASLQHGGDPGCWITYQERVAADELERRKLVLDEESESQNAGRYTLLDSTAKVTPKPSTIDVADYSTLLENGRDTILAIFGVPGPVVGVYDSATYNNVSTAHREHWGGVNGVLAFGRNVCDVVRNRLLARLASSDAAWEGWPAFDASHISALKEIRGEQMEKAARTSALGIGVSFDEAMHLQGTDTDLPELGSVKLISPAFSRVETEEEIPGPGDLAPDDGEDEEEDPALEAGGDGDGKPARTLPVPALSRRALLSARARRAVTKEGDEKIRERLAGWFRRFGAAEIAHLRAIAAGRRSEDGVLTRASPMLDVIVSKGDKLTVEDIKLLDQALERWARSMRSLTGGRMRAIYKDGAERAAQDIGKALLDITSPRILEKLAAHVAELAEGVTSTLAQQVRTTILRVFAGDAGPEASLRELLRRNLPELEGKLAKAFATKEQRAMMIARTETNWARQNGAVDQMKDSGVSMIEWVAEDDDATRLAHQARNGMIVPLGQEFAPNVRWPMDPNAPPEESIGCRCGALAAEFEEVHS